MPFKYTNPRTGRSKAQIGKRVTKTALDEGLTGIVQGLKASDLEERFARALAKMELPYEFRYRISSSLMGRQRLSRQFLNETGEVEIDFIVIVNGTTPVFIDGQIGHFYTDYQADKDAIKTNVTNEFGAAYNWRPAIRVPFWKLTDQDLTERTVRELFSNDWVVTTESVITTNAGEIVNTNTGSGYIWTVPGTVIGTINTQVMRHEAYLTSIGVA